MIQNLRNMKQYIVNGLLPALFSHPVSFLGDNVIHSVKIYISAYYLPGTFPGADRG